MDHQPGRSCVVFTLNEDQYALDIEHVIEITSVKQQTVLPEMPPHLLGLFHFRGRAVPLIDLKTRLGLPPATATKGDTSEQRIVIIDDNSKWTGLIVDAIHKVVELREDSLLERNGLESAQLEAIDGIYRLGEDEVLLLNYTALIDRKKEIHLADWKKTIDTHRACSESR